MADRHSATSAQGGTTAAGIVNAAKDRATAQLSNQKGRATEGLDVIAQAVRQTTDQLRQDHHDTIAQYVERAADHLERLSSSMRDKDVTQLLRDAKQFAQRQPALFIGGSLVAGILVARFLKSSGDNVADQERYAGAEAVGAAGGRQYGTRGSDPSPAGGL